MSLSAISGITAEELKTELHDRIFYNPMQTCYQLSDIFISGNVIEKAEYMERYIRQNPNSSKIEECKISLKVLQDAIPATIPFEQLSFNFGERWVNEEIYQNYVSEIFETKVCISYKAGVDGFLITTDEINLIITEKYAVKGESRTYNGIHLLHHALINTVPTITKTIKHNDEEIKVPDTEAIQLALMYVSIIFFCPNIHICKHEFEKNTLNIRLCKVKFEKTTQTYAYANVKLKKRP